MSKLNYLNLPGIGDWEGALKGVGAQLKPYRDYLQTAITAVERSKPKLAWREAAAEESKVFHERQQQRHDEKLRHAESSDRRRDRKSPAPLPKGVWIVLEPAPDRPEEPDETFEAFFNAKDIYDTEKCIKGRELEIKGIDREGRALLLDELPQLVELGVEESGEAKQVQLVWLRSDTNVLKRQLNAINTLDNQPRTFHAPLSKLMVTGTQWEQINSFKSVDQAWLILKKARDGTDEQRRFVEIALGTPDFALLEGPPGSGKTTAICELILQLAKQGMRVLLVASTHVAVDNVLERLIAWQDKPETLEKLVLPVRIGDEGKVTSDMVEPWCYHRLLKTWQAEITDFLENPHDVDPRANEARKILLQAVRMGRTNGESPISQLLLESSNLVCGTTVGILQHPAIKEARRNGVSVEPFDVMILDEASKTTFSEFLVPALLAKRWVVVGDIKQLSPYVETQYLEDNLSGLVPPVQAEAAAHCFKTMHRNFGPRWLAISSEEFRQALAAESGKRKIHFVDLDEARPRDFHGVPRAIPELLYADLIFGSPESLRRYQHRLPVNLQAAGHEIDLMVDWHAAHRGWKHKMNHRDQEEQDWAAEVAWRLIRSYELRQNERERSIYQKEIQELIPKSLDGKWFQFRGTKEHWPNGERKAPTDELQRELQNLRRCAFPSILELLQRGFERVHERHEAVALTDGLPSQILNSRLVSLSYQHRMHPDIAGFPRSQFYQRVHGPNLLQDAEGMTDRRSWSYPRYKRRAIWMEVTPHNRKGGKNENRAEVEAVIKELNAFVGWASQNPRSNKQPWEVSVLTFYRVQEKLLREELKRLSRTPGNTRNFKLPAGGSAVHVTLCTVDRFQGHEADLVLLSFVKTQTVGFLNSPNRLNVALTRARYQIVLIGHRAFFENDCHSSELLRSLATSDHYPSSISYGE